MLTVKHMKAAFLVSCTLILILLGLFSLSEETENNKMALIATDFGAETITHANFVNKLIRDTKLHQGAMIKIFLGQYYWLTGHEGFLTVVPPNYYVFIDMYFYYSLNQSEREALIAHELGHAIYEIDFTDKLQFKILHKLDIFKEWRNEILTKNQMRADLFSAKKTSPTAMISLLNKLYITNKESPDYKMRLENLNKLEQGH